MSAPVFGASFLETLLPFFELVSEPFYARFLVGPAAVLREIARASRLAAGRGVKLAPQVRGVTVLAILGASRGA